MSDDEQDFSWSLPPEETPLPPPPPTTLVTPPPVAPPPGPSRTGFGGPPDAYIPGPRTAEEIIAEQGAAPTPGFGAGVPVGPVPTSGPPGNSPVWKRWWFVASIAVALIAIGAVVVAGGDGDDGRTAGTEDTRDDRTDDTDADDTATDNTDSTDDTDTDGTETNGTDTDTNGTDVPDGSGDPVPSVTTSDPLGSVPIETTIGSVPELTVATVVPQLTTVPVSPATTTPGATVDTTATTSVATTAANPAEPVIGDLVTLNDGTTIRVNSVTHDAPPVQTFFEVDDGSVLTRITFEACAGTDGFASLNPLYWTGTLDNGDEADLFLFSFPIIVVELNPGSCVKSQLDLQAPAERRVASVTVRDTIFQDAATWSTGSSVAIGGPLTSPSPPAAAAIGQSVALGNGGTATVRSATPGLEPLDPNFPAADGRQLVRLDVEVCAGSSTIVVGPLNFFGTTVDNQIGTASYYGATFPTDSITPGSCASGLLDLDLVAGLGIGDVILSDDTSTEIARWRA